MLRRLAPAAVLTLALLAGCAGGDDPATPTATVTAETPAETAAPPTASPVESPTIAAQPTVEPTIEESGETDGAGEAEEPESTTEPTDERGVDTETDLYDGVRTNRFGAMPTAIDSMTQRRLNTDPKNHLAQIEYVSQDEQSRLFFAAWIPILDGERVHVTSLDEPVFAQEEEIARDAVEEVGPLSERSVDAGGLSWNCFESHDTSEGFDAVLCLSHRYGRMIEVQRLTAPEPDVDAWHAATDAVLAEVAEAVIALNAG